MGLIMTLMKNTLTMANPVWKKKAKGQLDMISLCSISNVTPPLCSICCDVLQTGNMQLINEILFAFLSYCAVIGSRDRIGDSKVNAYIIMAAGRSHRAGLVIDAINEEMNSQNAQQQICTLTTSGGIDLNSAIIRYLSEWVLVLLTRKTNSVNKEEAVSFLEETAHGMSALIHG